MKKSLKLGLIVSIVLLVGYLLFRLFIYSPIQNFEVAKIEKFNNNYFITLKGTRYLMTHDLISVLKKDTYIDSITFEIPRANGIIQGKEIPVKKGYYNLLGTINIYENYMTINLYHDNQDDHSKQPLSWNGHYKLSWVKK